MIIHDDTGATLYHGDACDILANLASQSVNCCVTSPPYYGLRDYDQDGQYGTEPTLGDYVDHLRQVCGQIWRVLADDGTCWVNLGDSYSGDQRATYGTNAGHTRSRGHPRQPADLRAAGPRRMVGNPALRVCHPSSCLT